MVLMSVRPVSTAGVAAVSLWENAGELESATSMHAAAIDDPRKRIGLLYEPVDALVRSFAQRASGS